MALKIVSPMPMATIEMRKFSARPQPPPKSCRAHASDGLGAVAPTIMPHRVGKNGFAYLEVTATATMAITPHATSQIAAPSQPPTASAKAPATGTTMQKATIKAISQFLDKNLGSLAFLSLLGSLPIPVFPWVTVFVDFVLLRRPTIKFHGGGYP